MTNTRTATLVRKKVDGWCGDARLYRLSEPLEGHTWIVVSAAVAPFSGPETYIFGTDAHGKCLDYYELPGSFRGSLDYKAALKGAGYAIVVDHSEAQP